MLHYRRTSLEPASPGTKASQIWCGCSISRRFGRSCRHAICIGGSGLVTAKTHWSILLWLCLRMRENKEAWKAISSEYNISLTGIAIISHINLLTSHSSFSNVHLLPIASSRAHSQLDCTALHPLGRQIARLESRNPLSVHPLSCIAVSPGRIPFIRFPVPQTLWVCDSVLVSLATGTFAGRFCFPLFDR
jgi:hypothetical protein